MAKPDPKTITANDLKDYLGTESDFALEIRVIKELEKTYGQVLHGGTYIDEITGKPRQFDIRAQTRSNFRVIRLAVECKNLKPTFPLLVSCLPRAEAEAYQQVIFSLDPDCRAFPGEANGFPNIPALETYHRTLELFNSTCMYRKGEPVGKTLAQVARDHSGTFTSNDAEVYGKWSQALSSADDLVSISTEDGKASESFACFSMVVPVLVVPDGTLWRCVFDFKGERSIEPEQVNRVQYYVGKEYVCGDHLTGGTYKISHLEIVTFSGIAELNEDLMSREYILPDSKARDFVNALERKDD